MLAVRESLEDVEEVRRNVLDLIRESTLREKSDLNSISTRLLERLHDLTSSCLDSSFVKRLGSNPGESFAVDCGLKVGIDKLISPTAVKCCCDVPKEVDVEVQSVRRLKNFPARVAEESEVCKFVGNATSAMDKCKTLLQETCSSDGKWSNIVDPLLSLLKEVANSTPVAELIAEDHEQVKRMAFNVDECEQQQQQAVAEGDMKLCEVLYFKKITLQEGMLDVFNRLYSRLDEEHVSGFVVPMKKVHEVHSQANAKITKLLKEQDTTKKTIELDIDHLHKLVLSQKKKNEEDTHKFTVTLQENQEALKENFSARQTIRTAIAELEKRLSNLELEGKELVDFHISTVDAELQRKVNFAKFNLFSDERIEQLSLTLQQCDVEEEVTDVFDEVVCNGCNAIESQLRDIEREIESCRMDVHEERLKHFRTLYLTLGDLQYKKERNMEELDKKIAHTHVQQELAMETFNPKAKEYSQTKKDLLKVRDEMESQLSVLQDKSVLHIEAFKPTEAALVKSGKEFLHPVQELENMNRSRQQKMIEYHNLMSSEDGDDASGLNVESELRAIEEARAAIQPRKPVSSHGMREDQVVASPHRADYSD